MRTPGTFGSRDAAENMKRSGGRAPRISVVIPTFNRPQELRVCLDGFANQTAMPGEFEVVVIDDGSAENIEKIPADFRDRFQLHLERCDHAGVSVARNRGIERSRAPLLLLYDDDLRPLPGLIEACLHFHDRLSAAHQMELLHFTPDRDIADMAVVRWAFDRLYPFPKSSGIHRWDYFWGGALTCKRSLFREHVFDPEFHAVEDAEFALRAGGQLGLEIHFEPRVSGHFHRRLSVMQICRRQYHMAYYRHLLVRRHGARFAHPVYERPNDFVIADWASYRTMLLGTRAQECAALSPSSAKFQLLSRLWQKAELHATASGWLTAQAGLGPSGPYTPLFE